MRVGRAGWRWRGSVRLRKERPQLSLGSFLRRSSASAGPCRQSQLFRDRSGRGSRQLKRFEACLAVRLGETAAQAFSEVASRPQDSTFWMIPMVIGCSKGRFCVAGIFLFLNPGGGHSLSGTVLGEIICLSRRTGLSGVFRSCRVAGLHACGTLRVGPPSLIVDQGLF